MTAEEFVGHVRNFYLKNPAWVPVTGQWVRTIPIIAKFEHVSQGCCGSIAAFCDMFGISPFDVPFIIESDTAKVLELSNLLKIDVQWLKGFIHGWDQILLDDQPEGLYKEGHDCGKKLSWSLINDRRAG